MRVTLRVSSFQESGRLPDQRKSRNRQQSVVVTSKEKSLIKRALIPFWPPALFRSRFMRSFPKSCSVSMISDKRPELSSEARGWYSEFVLVHCRMKKVVNNC